MTTPIVLSLGELLWDMLPSGKRAGGAPVNFAYHAMKNGTEGWAISAVGEDALGEFVRHKIRLADHQGVAQGILVEGLSRQHRFRRVPYSFQREHGVLIVAFGGIPFLRQHLDRI